MSDGFSIEIAQKPDMAEVKDKVVKVIRRQMGIHADAMKAYAGTKVPVRTGRLQQSINTRVTSTRSAVTITIGANARSDSASGKGEMYGPFVEYGTGQRGAAGGATYEGHTNPDIEYNAEWKGQEAKPFVRPAVYDLQDVLIEDLERVIAEAMR